MDKPILSKRAFKNVNMDEIDYENGALNVLERIIYRGFMEDIFAVSQFYGEDRIRKEIINSKCLGPKEVNFCCLIFDMEISDFKHYKEGRFRAFPEFKDYPEELADHDLVWITAGIG
jgi:hypothetical protein